MGVGPVLLLTLLWRVMSAQTSPDKAPGSWLAFTDFVDRHITRDKINIDSFSDAVSPVQITITSKRCCAFHGKSVDQILVPPSFGTWHTKAA